MANEAKPDGISRTNDKLYDAAYYKNYDQGGYNRDEEWLSFFSNIADKIVSKLSPKTVVDMGCAFGILVEALRDRGVDAYGIDISDYAVSCGRQDIKPFLSVGSILQPIKNRYDLVICIEVIEHLKEEDTQTAIENLCAMSDAVLLATTPDDFDDPTHFNVQPPRYWVSKFSECGFFADVEFDASFLTPYAILFRKNKKNHKTAIDDLFGAKKMLDYQHANLVHERNLLNISNVKISQENETLVKLLEQKESLLRDTNNHVQNLSQFLEQERHARAYYEGMCNAFSKSTSWRLTYPLRLISKSIEYFRPIKPQALEIKSSSKELEILSSSATKWVLVEDVDQAAKKPAIFNGLVEDGTDAFLPLRKLKSNREKYVWLGRIPAHRNSFSIKCHGYSDVSFKISEISRFNVLLALIIDKMLSSDSLWDFIKIVGRRIQNLPLNDIEALRSSFLPTEDRPSIDYQKWLKKHYYTRKQESARWVNSFDYKPLISIIIPTFNSNIDYLEQAINSVESQSYENWEICISDDCSSNNDVRIFLEKFSENRRIKIKFLEENNHISFASNKAAEMASGEFLAFLDHDDLLHHHALALIVGSLNLNRKLDFLYTDEDKLDEYGQQYDPNFKPMWNPDLLLSQNYLCHFVVLRRKLFEEVGGFRSKFDGAQDYDLFLRITEKTNAIAHIPYILYHWRAAKGSTAKDSQSKDYAHSRAREALKDAIKRRELKAEVTDTGFGVYHRIKYEIPSPCPVVSVIIPTRDFASLVHNVVDGLISGTNYPALEIIIVDNESKEPATFELFATLQKKGVTILEWSGAFNYAAINNFAVSKASGEIIVLLNNDVEVLHESWLFELVSHAVRDGVGAVGARLYYPNETVQHDGIIVGMGGVAGYAHPGLPRAEHGRFGRSMIIQNFSAVTAAVLAVKKSLYEEVGGLDEKNLKVAFNDVDFCLKLQQLGYRNVYTPFAELYHHESISRGPDTDPGKAKRFETEALFMKKKWGLEINDDPSYNPNLSLTSPFELDLERSQSWPWEKTKVVPYRSHE